MNTNPDPNQYRWLGLGDELTWYELVLFNWHSGTPLKFRLGARLDTKRVIKIMLASELLTTGYPGASTTDSDCAQCQCQCQS